MALRAKSRAQTGRERHSFTINVRLYTGEIFPLKSISGDMKISDLKQYMEFATGIPIHMQRISYLDDGESEVETLDVKCRYTIVSTYIYCIIIICNITCPCEVVYRSIHSLWIRRF